MLQHYDFPETFYTEQGGALQLSVSYTTTGTLNADGSNVVWICHALTANADAASWWPGLVGDGSIIDPAKYFIVCANIMGSCYGTTGPLSTDPLTGVQYLHNFPLITIRDMVAAHQLLRKHLGIDKLFLLAGGSMGGYQALEWALLEPGIVQNMLLLATSAAESAWGIGIHTAQRMAIEADATWHTDNPDAGAAGLKAARAIGILTYRNHQLFSAQQTDHDTEKVEDFKASSYLNYQGNKLVKRFNAYSYWTLTKAMDAHNLARGRAATLSDVLRTITQPTLVIGVSSDILCPPQEQQYLAAHMPHATYKEIDSSFGHDGFLVETEKISALLDNWLKGKRHV